MEKLLKFLETAGKLKKIKRTGWVLRKVPSPETVAEHSFRTAILALILADELKANRQKLVEMALIHDIPEVIVGDITPFDKINSKEKLKLEKKAMLKVCSKISNGKKLMALWTEFAKGKTKEAKLLNQLDKIEMIVQAMEYEKEYKSRKLDLGNFWQMFKKAH